MQSGILLEVGRNARVDAMIEPGSVQEVVSVNADAPLVETNSASLTRTVGQKEVLNLPLVNRDLYTLLSITGGISSNTSSNSLGGPEQLTTINGSQNAQIGSVNFQLDGGNNTAGLRGTGNPAPNPEAVQEFRVITNSYAAEYGRYQAGVVDVVTKSGTNMLHGAGFGFFRNENLNSKRWAPPGVRRHEGSARSEAIRRGARRTAPQGQGVLLRQLFRPAPGRNLLSQHRRRAHRARARRQLLAVGDQAARSEHRAAVPGRRHSVGAIRSGGPDDSEPLRARVEPAEQLLRSAPARSARNRRRDVQVRLSVDADARDGGELLLSEGQRHAAAVDVGNIPWVDRDFKWKQHNINFADSWTLSPTMINQLRVTYMRQFGGRVNSPTTSLGDLNSKFQIQGDPTLPRLTVSGYFTGQAQIAGPDAGSNYFAVKDSLSIARGNHWFKLGGEVSYEKIVHDTLLDNYGVFTFNGSKTGNAYADFMLGLPATMTQDAPVRKTDNGAYISLFAQDDYRIHPRLTLNLGVRYDLQLPYTDPRQSQAGVRAGRAVDGVADRAGGTAVPRR